MPFLRMLDSLYYCQESELSDHRELSNTVDPIPFFSFSFKATSEPRSRHRFRKQANEQLRKRPLNATRYLQNNHSDSLRNVQTNPLQRVNDIVYTPIQSAKERDEGNMDTTPEGQQTLP